jgi:hypothetical protein
VAETVVEIAPTEETAVTEAKTETGPAPPTEAKPAEEGPAAGPPENTTTPPEVAENPTEASTSAVIGATPPPATEEPLRRWSGNRTENTFTEPRLGLSLTLPPGWRFSDKQEDLVLHLEYAMPPPAGGSEGGHGTASVPYTARLEVAPAEGDVDVADFMRYYAEARQWEAVLPKQTVREGRLIHDGLYQQHTEQGNGAASVPYAIRGLCLRREACFIVLSLHAPADRYPEAAEPFEALVKGWQVEQ